MFAAAALAALSMIACSDDTTSPMVSTVTVSADSVITVGGTTLIAVVASDQNGGVLVNPTITYVSSDTTIATVTPAGLVTGVADGVVTITATVESHSGTLTIRVAPAPAAPTSRTNDKQRVFSRITMRAKRTNPLA
jgi:uncharacterized protein YjdB